jgi:RNA polymerase sigma-70 factor (ECF subfamily)
MPPEKEINKRLDTVLHIIYLLFNEGYYSATQNQILRKELCLEALQLGLLLAGYDKTNLPKTSALIALMCFHASRFDARQNDANNFIVYEQQDEALWNKELIEQGKHFLHAAANGNGISSYHLEAGIAFWHCCKEETKEKWQHILQHYDLLLQINYSPVVALNRIYALYKVKGKETALKEAEQLQLTNNHFYFTLLGELYSGMDNNKAKAHFQTAISLARTATEKQSIGNKIAALK